MKINFPKEELISLFRQHRDRLPAVIIIIFTLIIAAGIYKKQANILQTIRLKKDAEVSKNMMLGEINQSEKRIKSYQDMLTEKDLSTITDKITKLAKDSNIKIISIEPRPQEKQPLYIKYPLTVSIKAQSYHAIGKFISRIENYSSLYFVNAISIKPTGESQAFSQKSEKGGAPAADKLAGSLTLDIIIFTGEK